MIGLETLSGNAQGIALLGLVLIEAVVLHSGYGLVARSLSPELERAVERTVPDDA